MLRASVFLVAAISFGCAAGLSTAMLSWQEAVVRKKPPVLPCSRQNAPGTAVNMLRLGTARMCIGYGGQSQSPNDFWWNSPRGGEHDAQCRAKRRASRVQQRSAMHDESHGASHTIPVSGPPAMDTRFQTGRLGSPTVFVLIFNAGEHNEGVYTQTHPDESGVIAVTNTVLGFECLENAEHFSHLLLAKGFDLAVPVPWNVDRLRTFVRRAGYEERIFDCGSMPTLPSELNHEEPIGSESSKGRRDPYQTYRMWIEDLLRIPDICGNDDCSVPRVP